MTRKIVPMLLLAVAAASAYAEWTRVDEGPASAIYADTATVRRDGDKAGMWDLQDFRVAQSRPYGTAYLSRKTQREYDCSQARVRTLQVIQYAGNMAGGDVTSSEAEAGGWEAPAGGAGQALWKLACGR